MKDVRYKTQEQTRTLFPSVYDLIEAFIVLPCYALL